MKARYFAAAVIMLIIQNASAMDLGGNFWNLGWHRPNDCFNDVKNVNASDPWNPQFLKEISIYKSLRFMDWDKTNNSQRSRWSERNTRDNPVQNPAAYEWMIDLCNRNGSDMWVTLPHLTVNRSTGDNPCDYAIRLSILVKTGVDMKEIDLKGMLGNLSTMTDKDLVAAGGVKTCQPLRSDLKLFVEYSNETWNGMFKQSHYCCDEGTALGLDENRWTAGFRFHTWAAIRLFRAAELVFGKDSDRIVKVDATQSANSWITGQHIKVMNDPKLNPWMIKPDVLATAPYFGHGVDGSDPDVVNLLKKAIAKTSDQCSKQKEIADEAGLRLMAYEGGQHVTKNAKEINQDPVMYDLYMDYFSEMSRYFEHFVYYCHVGRAGNGGAWGCIEYTGQPISEAHKYRALVDWAKKNNTKGDYLYFEGNASVKKNKHIVLVTGDEEYRSEESMPMLAKILAEHHGFDCTVLFAINPDTGLIDPVTVTNIPGLEKLDDADLMIMFIRFRQLPDEQMKHIIDYTNSGRPIIALRTSTHPFRYDANSKSQYAKYTFNSKEYPGGYGRQVLGETWISHYGDHKVESTRGYPAKGQENNPILNGVKDIWGPSDVYGLTTLLGDCKPVLMGQPLVGMKPTDGPNTKKKALPVAWTKTFTGTSGKAAKVFVTTMGHAGDFKCEDFRRMMVNACYWAVDMEDEIPARAKVDIIGEYDPVPIGFGAYKKGLSVKGYQEKYK